MTGEPKNNLEDEQKKAEEATPGEQKIVEEKSTIQELKEALTGDKAKIALLIIGFLIYSIVAWRYFHPVLVLGSAIGFPIEFAAIKKTDSQNRAIILELNPKNWQPQLYKVDPDFLSGIEAKDEPATLEADKTEVLEEDDEGNIQIAMKGIQNTQDGQRLFVCQDFAPDEGYIHFGWLDGMTPYEWILKKTKFAQLTAFIDKIIAKYADEQSSARSMAVEDIEKFIEKWGRVGEDKKRKQEESKFDIEEVLEDAGKDRK